MATLLISSLVKLLLYVVAGLCEYIFFVENLRHKLIRFVPKKPIKKSILHFSWFFIHIPRGNWMQQASGIRKAETFHCFASGAWVTGATAPRGNPRQLEDVTGKQSSPTPFHSSSQGISYFRQYLPIGKRLENLQRRHLDQLTPFDIEAETTLRIKLF